MPTYKNNSTVTKILDEESIAPNELIETYQILTDPDFVKVSDEPYYPLVLSTHTITFSGAETKQVPTSGDLLDAGVIRIRTDVDVTVKPNSANNPYGYVLLADEERDFLNEATIETIFLESTGSGTATLLELVD